MKFENEFCYRSKKYKTKFLDNLKVLYGKVQSDDKIDLKPENLTKDERSQDTT